VEPSARLDLRLQQGDRAGARGIRNIMVAEVTKEMWRQLRHLNCNSCSVLTDQVEIRHALICRNRLHFGQAHGTFPTVPPSKRQLLLQGQLDLLNYAISHSYTYIHGKKLRRL
jgi:hypothetical protein